MYIYTFQPGSIGCHSRQNKPCLSHFLFLLTYPTHKTLSYLSLGVPHQLSLFLLYYSIYIMGGRKGVIAFLWGVGGGRRGRAGHRRCLDTWGAVEPTEIDPRLLYGWEDREVGEPAQGEG